jgi:hypothetical protein
MNFGGGLMQELALTLNKRHDRQQTSIKMKDKMPTLQQNQKNCIPTLKVNANAAHLLLPQLNSIANNYIYF